MVFHGPSGRRRVLFPVPSRDVGWLAPELGLLFKESNNLAQNRSYG